MQGLWDHIPVTPSSALRSLGQWVYSSRGVLVRWGIVRSGRGLPMFQSTSGPRSGTGTGHCLGRRVRALGGGGQELETCPQTQGSHPTVGDVLTLVRFCWAGPVVCSGVLREGLVSTLRPVVVSGLEEASRQCMALAHPGGVFSPGPPACHLLCAAPGAQWRKLRKHELPASAARG